MSIFLSVKQSFQWLKSFKLFKKKKNFFRNLKIFKFVLGLETVEMQRIFLQKKVMIYENPIIFKKLLRSDTLLEISTVISRNWSFIQLQFRKIKIEFQKIQLLFSKLKKQFFNFQLQSVEYSNTSIWKF